MVPLSLLFPSIKIFHSLRLFPLLCSINPFALKSRFAIFTLASIYILISNMLPFRGAVVISFLATSAYALPLIARGTSADGCTPGSYECAPSQSCSAINTCVYAKSSTLVGAAVHLIGAALDLNAVLDLSSNTCLTVSECTSIKTREVTTQSVAGIAGLKVCTTKVCTGTLVLVSFYQRFPSA